MIHDKCVRHPEAKINFTCWLKIFTLLIQNISMHHRRSLIISVRGSVSRGSLSRRSLSGKRVGSMHPTGMHSCFECLFDDNVVLMLFLIQKLKTYQGMGNCVNQLKSTLYLSSKYLHLVRWY